MLSFLSRPADCRTEVDDVSFEEKVGDMVRSMSLIPTSKVSKDNILVNGAARKITFRSVKGGVEVTEERSCLRALKGCAARFIVVKFLIGCESIGEHPVSQ